MVSIKSPREINLMRESCQLAAKTLNHVGRLLQVGMTTEDINQIVHDYITQNGAYPSPLNYKGFPKSVCTSLNQVVCHGIPSTKDKLRNGDILNIDVTTYFKKFHGDTNRTFLIGEVSEKRKKLVEVTYQAMLYGIQTVRPGSTLGDIGFAIASFVEKNNYSVVRDYCGHGIGREFHEDPQVMHYGQAGKGMVLREGMTFTIEPMVNEGDYPVKLLKDGWTVVTKDGSWSAQFEHTLVVTSSGFEILTLDPDHLEHPYPVDDVLKSLTFW